MKTEDFDYALPEDLIAAIPVKNRESSRLLVLNRENGLVSHKYFTDLVGLLRRGDLLVVNNSKVFPARLFGVTENGGHAEILLNHEISPGKWEAIGKNLKEGRKIVFEKSNLTADVLKRDGASCFIQFNFSREKLFDELEKIGHIPLPPYIEKQREKKQINFLNDKERYQTVYAKKTGSVAAPTAGLHFTEQLFDALRDQGIEMAETTLHVGLGTFAPIKTEKIEDHEIHEEFYNITEDNFAKIEKAKKEGRRVIAVGTTSVRVLEHIFSSEKPALSSWTKIYIYPGYKFHCVDGMITNFHLPKSSLLLLVSAFAGRENILQAYKEAIQNKYHFYSYGDAMLII